MDEKELENLLETYSETVRAICRKYFLMGGNQDDLFQEGMIGLLEAYRSFDKSRGSFNSKEFKNFALLCIKRQIYDAIKKANNQKNMALNNYVSFTQKNKNNDEFEMDFDNGAELANELAKNPEQIVLNREDSDLMLNELNKNLSDFEKEVLKLYLDGLTQSKIATKLDKDVKQIDNTIQRIKKKAKEIKV
ncbi:MAG: sigma-70 family RNA polymerase sigma factor [Clostridia bacterium]|nr:sigma-70 family RNA polymerase sigma factor [Clostridia bacterium]